MDPVSVPHMTPEEFRRRGHAVIDWIAEYMQNIDELPVQSRVAPGDVLSRLPAHPPERGESWDDVLQDFDEIVVPGLTHWQSPNFYAYFPANNSGPSILGELLSAGLGVQGMLWATSPACTELETAVLDWVVELLDLPKTFRSDGLGGGVIQDTASSATLCALLAARERTTAGTTNRAGTTGNLTVYASSQAHSSVEKAVRIAGIGVDNLRLIDVDDAFAMKPDVLDRAITADKAAGRSPCLVVATTGTTSSMALDPLVQIGTVCEEHGIWLHVDAAMAGSAMVCPEFRILNEGLERADSYCFNPHKWLLVNFDCDCFYVTDRSALIGALSVLPEYLRNTASESGAVIDYRDWQVPLGRRFRALKLWFVIRHYGADGLRKHIRAHVDLAAKLAAWVESDPEFELAAPVMLNLVCFRHRAGDEFNERLLQRLNSSGDLYLTHTKLDGRFTLRMAIGSPQTRAHHVRAAWDRIKEESVSA
jgi:aromatic-L-amino-acid decarboxylase